MTNEETDNNNETVAEETNAAEHAKAETRHAHEPKENIVPLLVIIAAVVATAVITHTFNTVLVLVAIVVMVMIHEFGHFLTAKWSGMKVTEYFLGFGPRIWSFRRGETEYGVRAIPAGGYVRVIGMTNAEKVSAKDEPRTYRQSPYWRRVVMASAGSFMHFVMAFLILMILFAGLGMRPAAVVDKYPQSLESAPAHQAGILPGDKITSINNKPVRDWIAMQDMVRAMPNQQATLGVIRNGKKLDVVVPIGDRTNHTEGLANGVDPKTVGFLGARRADVYQRDPFFTSVHESASLMWESSKMAVTALVHRFSPSGIESVVRQVRDARSNGAARAEAKRENKPAPVTETDKDDSRLVSPLGIVNFSNQAAHAGIRSVLQFLFGVNLFVGIFNMVPLLPFDGGHVAIATYEKLRSLRGKRHFTDYRKLAVASYAVLFVLVAMGLSAFWLDAWYPAQNSFG